VFLATPALLSNEAPDATVKMAPLFLIELSAEIFSSSLVALF
jgi:hypothetical protein